MPALTALAPPRRCRCQLSGAMAPVDPRMRALGSRWVDPWPCVLNAPCGLACRACVAVLWIDCLQPASRWSGLPVSRTCPRTRPGTPSTLHTTPKGRHTLQEKGCPAGGTGNTRRTTAPSPVAFPHPLLAFSPPLVMAASRAYLIVAPSKTQEAWWMRTTCEVRKVQIRCQKWCYHGALSQNRRCPFLARLRHATT